jgi:hypothetical protein
MQRSKDAKKEISRFQSPDLRFPRSQSLTGNVIFEVLPLGIMEAEPLNYIPTQSMGTREREKAGISRFSMLLVYTVYYYSYNFKH